MSNSFKPRWSLRHLAFVAEAARTGSITAAAHGLEVSQAALSGAIDNIEETFGVRLFRRQPGRGLTLTPAGQILMAKVERLLAEAADLEATAHQLSSRLSGALRLGCFPTAVPHIVPSLMEGLRRAYPAMTIELQEATISDLAARLRAHEIDVALTYDLSREEGVVFEKLFSVRQHVATADFDELARHEAVSLSDLVHKPMILLDLPVCREHVLEAYHNLGLQPKIHFKTGSTTVMERLVATGQGYAMLGFRPHPDSFGAMGNIRFLRVLEPLPEIDFGVGLAKGAERSRAIEAFIGLVRELAPQWAVT